MRLVLAALVGALLLAGCGYYGPPQRGSDAAPPVANEDADDERERAP